MKKFLVSCGLIIFFFNSNAQEFYKDIFLTRHHNEKHDALKKAGVRKVTLSSLEADGIASEGFSGEQQLSPSFDKMITRMTLPASASSYIENTYDSRGRLVKTYDSTEISTSITEYSYDDKGNLSRLSNSSYATGLPPEEEVHEWKTDASGHYIHMTKKRNGSEITEYELISDEKGNVIEERPSRNGKALPVVFYYYDDQNRLTDVVRYNARAKRLLPDFVMEYNPEGQLSTLMIVPEGSDDYQRWVYQYDSNGLRTKESCYNKRKMLQGVMKYAYSS